MKLPKPYCEWPGVGVLFYADSTLLISEIEADAIVTDPPYGISYQHGGAIGGIYRGRRRIINPRNPPIAGDDKPFDPSHLLDFKQLIVFGADHFLRFLPDGGSLLCFDKRDEVGPDDSFADAEFAWCSRPVKRNVFRFLWKGLCCAKKGENNGVRVHPTQKPVALMRWCLSHFPEANIIADPYFGSGTTGVACIQMGKKFIGLEIDEGHCETAKARIDRELAQPRLPFVEPPKDTQAELFSAE